MSRIAFFEARAAALVCAAKRIDLATSLTVLAAFAVIVSQVLLIGDYQVDDAYISFAFAKNLAAGNGLTYSAGLRVEGYSNFLWTVLSAVVQLLAPEHLYLGMQAAALGCVALTLVYVHRLTARYSNARWGRAAALFTALATDLTGVALSALETAAYTAVLTVTIYYYLTEDRARRRVSAWCLLMLALVRIDGIVHVAFFTAFTGLIWLLERRAPRLRDGLRWLGLPALLYFAYFAWRYSYYGLPLPTTYYAKSLVHAAMPNRGLEYVQGAIVQLGLPLVAAFAVIALLRRRTRARFLIALLVLFHFGYVQHVGGDWMPFHRFIVPVLPLTTVLAAWGVFDVWQFGRRRPWPVRVLLAPALLACAAYVAALQNGYSIDTPQERDELGSRRHTATHTRELVEARRLYRWVTRAPGEKMVSDYGGVFAYYTDALIIEMWGLCNADIALRGNAEGINPIFGKTCIECYRDFQPDYFHANVPLQKPVSAIASDAQMLSNIFQASALDRVLDFRKNYVTGRVVDDQGMALYFLERKRPGLGYSPRHPAPHITVEYPFLRAE